MNVLWTGKERIQSRVVLRGRNKNINVSIIITDQIFDQKRFSLIRKGFLP